MHTLQNTLTTALMTADVLFQRPNIIPVFDMDGVFADATHRQICNPDGSLNLERYREMSTLDNILKDKTLPLAIALKELTKHRREFHICTARVACSGTLAWLDAHKIKPVSIMARQGEEDTRKDYLLKTDNLTAQFSKAELKKAILFDDNLDNCKAALGLRMLAFHVPFHGH